MRKILTLACMVLLALVNIAEARYCNNPNCAMCNRLFGPIQTVIRTDITNITKVDIVKAGQESTSYEMVYAILKAIPPKKDEVIYDLGCGDARFLIAAVQKYGCRAVGIEKDRTIANNAWARVKRLGLDDKIKVYCGDITKSDYSKADYIFVYLYPDLLKRLNFNNTKVVVSYMHSTPKSRKLMINNQPVYLILHRVIKY